MRRSHPTSDPAGAGKEPCPSCSIECHLVQIERGRQGAPPVRPAYRPHSQVLNPPFCPCRRPQPAATSSPVLPFSSAHHTSIPAHLYSTASRCSCCSSGRQPGANPGTRHRPPHGRRGCSAPPCRRPPAGGSARPRRPGATRPPTRPRAAWWWRCARTRRRSPSSCATRWKRRRWPRWSSAAPSPSPSQAGRCSRR